MTRKIILNLAMSLDGYIADEKGGYDWIKGDGNKANDYNAPYQFDKFLESVDLVVMGRNCYDQGMHKEYPHKEVWVVTHDQTLVDHEHVHFVKEDPVSALQEVQKKEGKNIYLFGGGLLVDTFIKAQLINEYWVGIIPVLLGRGRPLFYSGSPYCELSLLHTVVDEGIVIMQYEVKKDSEL